jgi:hypothetical protein
MRSLGLRIKPITRQAKYRLYAPNSNNIKIRSTVNVIEKKYGNDGQELT